MAQTQASLPSFPDLPLLPTDPRWLDVALADLDAVYCDHLHCERKAAQSALSLVRGYPEHPELVAQVARLAHEETSHVVQVSQLLAKRGVELRYDVGDDYAFALRKHVRKHEPGRLIDTLLVFALIEARSAERLGLLAGALEAIDEIHEPDAALYRALASAEVRHRDLFLRLAAHVAGAEDVQGRLRELAIAESEIVAALPIRPRIH